jgi:redox-sensitive bicupin YhaK (pirin superfamily)
MEKPPYRLIRGVEAVDGAGVRLTRIIASRELLHSDPFVLLDEIRSNDPDDYIEGFPTHPHRGIETVTYMVEGKFRHRDSRGNGGVLSSGDVQWMTAGRGILHSEMPEPEARGIWGYQLWLTLPREHKFTAPRYQHLDESHIPTAEKDGLRVKVITGEFEGVKGPAGTFFPVHYFDVRLEPRSVFAFDIPSGMNAHAYVHTGAPALSQDKKSNPIPEKHLALFEPLQRIELRADSVPGGFLFFCAAPLNEPIVRGGPFVMNTREELQKAFRDWENGTIDRDG